jgi:hypothetical protein
VYSQFALRTAIPPAFVVSEVRKRVREVMKTVAVDHVTTMAEQVDASIVPERLMVTLSGLFGALGGLPAAVGLYGLLAYTVARRTNETGIRMALGATRARVIRAVLTDALRTVCAGLVLALPLALWGKSVAAGLVPGLEADLAAPITSGAAAMVALALLRRTCRRGGRHAWIRWWPCDTSSSWSSGAQPGMKGRRLAFPRNLPLRWLPSQEQAGIHFRCQYTLQSAASAFCR